MDDWDEKEFDEEAYAASKAYEKTVCCRCNKQFKEGKEPIFLIYPEDTVFKGRR